MPRLCQDARGLLPMALLRAPDTAVTSASGAEKRRGRAITRGHIIRDKSDTINCPSHRFSSCENNISVYISVNSVVSVYNLDHIGDCEVTFSVQMLFF